MNSRFKMVQDCPGLVRDTNSGGILNVDDTAYLEHKRKKQLSKLKLEQEQNKEKRINSLEKEVKELKQGINQILEILRNANN